MRPFKPDYAARIKAKSSAWNTALEAARNAIWLEGLGFKSQAMATRIIAKHLTEQAVHYDDTKASLMAKQVIRALRLESEHMDWAQIIG